MTLYMYVPEEIEGNTETQAARRNVVCWFIHKGVTPKRLERALARGTVKDLCNASTVEMGVMRDLIARWGLKRDAARAALRESKRG